MTDIKIGILGGSGLYDMPDLEDRQEHQLTTPYGTPSDSLISGRIQGIPVVFLARHGRGHRLLPGEVPYQANVYAMKQLGVRYLISFSAVGSLSEEIAPLDMVLPDQYIDMTRQRPNSFFGAGAVAHVSMSEPVCPALTHLLANAVQQLTGDDAVRLHQHKTYICIEGPQFSTQAESHWYRSMGAGIIGMTNMPEARLAREAQIAYASLGMVTDFDCWHPKEPHVSADYAIDNLMKNAQRAEKIALNAIKLLAQSWPESIAHNALASGLVTPLDVMDSTTRERISLLLK
ncbi:S-methyl-5'-thioadenosine phosphorylase [Nitrincola sp. A-D6]|uniref:S-methyl-5'-thioadenosine phosphorylase n=1 Tax=Nitrincola sp. A-D6 TaxID=1545442 RepID=UPI00051FAE8C|nr:S-methyl-5'-thioadenosine phosphorylase [Nitrincola sp. A-D6]KGK41528.1 S-methyl-5'-thioadenosine phosphorylase [Nitrincola sp. A-D6]